MRYLSRRSALESRARAWAADNNLSLLDRGDYRQYRQYHAGADVATRNYLDASRHLLINDVRTKRTNFAHKLQGQRELHARKVRRRKNFGALAVVVGLLGSGIYVAPAIIEELRETIKQREKARYWEELKQLVDSGAPPVPNLIPLEGGRYRRGSFSGDSDEVPVKTVTVPQFLSLIHI